MLRERFARTLKTKTRDESCTLLEGTDACFAPVLTLSETPRHPHNVARATFVEVDGVTQPGPAPRFSRTPSKIRSGPALRGQHTDSVLSAWGFTREELVSLRASGAIA